MTCSGWSIPPHYPAGGQGNPSNVPILPGTPATAIARFGKLGGIRQLIESIHTLKGQFSSNTFGGRMLDQLGSCAAPELRDNVMHFAIHDDVAVFKEDAPLTDRRNQVKIVADHKQCFTLV